MDVPPIHDGVLHPAYANERSDVTALVPPAARRVLDLGCSTGVMGAALRRAGHSVVGVEYQQILADQAVERLDRVIVADIEALARDGADPGGPFDCIVAADVLEHLRDPWSVSRWAVSYLAVGGSLVISVPNIRHLRLVSSLLLRRRWPYEDVGIFDRTHLRWFAYRNLPALLEGTGLEIVELRRTYLIRIDPTAPINRLAPYLGDLGTLQFVFRAECRGRTS